MESVQNEMLMTNRLIKNEVIDTADLVEKISEVVMQLNDKIEAQSQKQEIFMAEMREMIAKNG